MIEIYKARKILRKIDAKYGHTEPWVILCEGQVGWSEFVVKIFSEAHLADKPRVHGEFLGSWLSGEFDLMTPEVAWIEMDQDFMLSIPPEFTIGKDLDDDRLKFGSKILKSFQHYPKGFKLSKLKELIPIDRLFAFDNLIRNPDRGFYKPNLLLTEDDAYLIDHEYALDIDGQTVLKVRNYEIPGKLTTSHISYHALMKASSNEKAGFFEDFYEFLRVLNLLDLQAVLLDVTAKGYHADVDIIMEYFRFVKGNPAIFVQGLKSVLS